jgi:hypothetical protein
MWIPPITGAVMAQRRSFLKLRDLKIVANPDPTLTPEFRKYASGGNVSTPYKSAWNYTEGAEDQFNRTDSKGFSATYDHELDWAWLTIQYGHRSSDSHQNWVMTQSPTLQPLGTTTGPFWLGVDTIDLETGEITPAGSGFGVQGPGYANYPWNTYTVPKDPITGDDIPVTEMILYAPTTSNAVATDTQSISRMSQVETRLTSIDSIANGDKTEWIVGAMYMDDYVREKAKILKMSIMV